MRDYGTIRTATWTGKIGRQLRQAGSTVRLLYHYVKTCPSSNMMGLYYLSLATLCHEIGCSLEGARKALRSLAEMGLAFYDEASEFVWVPSMAAEEIGDRLKPGDKRIAGVKRQLEGLRNTPFFNDFLTRYREVYDLKDMLPNDAPSMGHRSPSDAPPKPGTGTIPETGPGQDTHTASPPAVLEQFEREFWNPYPGRNGRKQGKEKALLIWTHEYTDQERAQIAIAVQHLNADPNVQRGIGIKDPHRFLKKETLKNGSVNYPWKDWLEPTTQGGCHANLNGKDYRSGTW